VSEWRGAAADQEVRRMAMELTQALRPGVKDPADGSTNVLCKKRYQLFGASGAVVDHNGKLLFAM
jgi:hypothetical protein